MYFVLIVTLLINWFSCLWLNAHFHNLIWFLTTCNISIFRQNSTICTVAGNQFWMRK